MKQGWVVGFFFLMLISNWTVNKSNVIHILCFPTSISKRRKEVFLSSGPSSEGKLQCKLPRVVLAAASALA